MFRPPDSPIDSTADSIYLDRIIHAFEPGLHHTTSSCKFWKWQIFKSSNGLKNNERRFRQSAAVATMHPQQAKDHTHFSLGSACGFQIERSNNLNSCKLRWRSFETNWEPNLFRDWETRSFSAVARSRTWLVKTQWTFQNYVFAFGNQMA